MKYFMAQASLINLFTNVFVFYTDKYIIRDQITSKKKHFKKIVKVISSIKKTF